MCIQCQRDVYIVRGQRVRMSCAIGTPVYHFNIRLALVKRDTTPSHLPSASRRVFVTTLPVSSRPLRLAKRDFCIFCRSLYVQVRFLCVGGTARDGAYRHPPWMRRRCVLRARPVRQRVSPVPDTSVCVFPLPGTSSQSGVNYHIQVFPPLSEMIPL